MFYVRISYVCVCTHTHFYGRYHIFFENLFRYFIKTDENRKVKFGEKKNIAPCTDRKLVNFRSDSSLFFMHTLRGLFALKRTLGGAFSCSLNSSGMTRGKTTRSACCIIRKFPRDLRAVDKKKNFLTPSQTDVRNEEISFRN